MKKMITVAELSAFSEQITKTITHDEKNEFIDYIAKNPKAGDIIPGTGGIRKVRWKSKNKGKSGGVRIVYYFYDEYAPIFLLAAYAKSEQENLTNEQKKQISLLAQVLKNECKLKRK